MKKRVLSLFLASMLAVASLTACGDTKGVSKDDKTLNIRVCKAGYGDDAIRALAAAFSSAYAEEGYQVNIVSADSSIQGTVVTNELLLGENNGIDMYFTANVSPSLLVTSSLESDMDMIAADLSDVYTSTPIGSDGVEEDITIAEKLKSGFIDYQTYYGDEEEYNGKQYGFPLRTSPSGFVVNEELLSQYGLELPRTTDELVNCYTTIAAKTEETGVYPNAWAGYNASSYWYMVEDVWVAQYSGVENYQKFLTMEYSDDMSEGWKVYEDEGWTKSIEVLEVLLNQDYAPAKTISMDHNTAQHKFLSGEAVFMSNGAWLQNEMAANYEAEAKKLVMIQTPVISALGVKLGLDGNGGTDTAKCDIVLSQIVSLIDNGNTDDEIITEVSNVNAVTVTTEQIASIRTARAIYYDKGVEETVILNAYSDKLDIAKLFLRFIASDDGCEIMFDYSASYAPYTTQVDLTEGASDSAFMNSVHAIANQENASYIHRRSSGYRYLFNVDFFSKHTEYEKAIASSRGKLTAEEIMADELEYAKEIWAKRVESYSK